VVEPPRFRILGPIQAAGRRVSRGRTLALLALLLVNGGAIVPVEGALEALWEADRPRHGRKAVHVVASRLRSALGEGVVRSHGYGYALAMAPGELDADRFEGLARRGRAELASGDPREAAETLGQALALWRGPALADVADADFAQPVIARLEDLRLACVSDRIDADLACGRHAHAIGELEALVREHPLRERLRGQQMLALYRAGRQADALQAYRHACDALIDGLGIEPSPDFRALETAIARHEVPPPVAAHGPLEVGSRRLVTCLFAQRADELVGRDPEWLRRVLHRYHHTAGTLCAEHDGVVVESRSDAVLAVFGTPQRAYRAATALVASGARCGIATGEVVALGRHLVGEPVGSAERLGLTAGSKEIRLDERTLRMVRHAA
jgi:DNA-binding SARP family transcriptional activator